MVSISLQRREKLTILYTSENIGLKSHISNSEINVDIKDMRKVLNQRLTLKKLCHFIRAINTGVCPPGS